MTYLDGHGDSWTQPAELAALREWSRTAKLVVEVGTWTGRSAEAILSGMDDGNTNGVLICVDHFQGSPGNMAYGRWVEDEAGREKIRSAWRERLKKWRDCGRCMLVEMASDRAAQVWMDGLPALDHLFGESAWEVAWGKPADFIFLDGDHLPSALQRDIDLWWPLVRPGGFLCGHDYNIVLEAVQSRFAVDKIQTGPVDLWRVDKPADVWQGMCDPYPDKSQIDLLNEAG